MTRRSPDHAPRIPAARISALCAWACLLLAVALPVTVAAYWILTPSEQILTKGLGPGHGVVGLQAWQWTAALAASLLPVAALSWGLLQARFTLRAFSRGEFFTARSVRGLRGFAQGVFLAAAGGLAGPTVLGLILTANAAPGQHTLTVAMSSDALLGLLVGGVFWVVAGALAQGVELADENRLFV